jgi:hypothetical protein
VGFPLLSWFFMDSFGLVLGGTLVLMWLLIGPARSAFWAASVVLTASGAMALIAGGLPRRPVVGAQFGVDHLLAHRVVGAALGSAVFAGVIELMDLRRDPSALPAARLIRWIQAAGRREEETGQGISAAD